MKILMLSWEYPPKNVGGLSSHVYNLAKALARHGNEVHVISCEEGIAPIEEVSNGVHIYRVTPYKIETSDFTKWVMHLNFAMIEECIRIMDKIGKVDLIHAHDWLSAYAAKVLKWSFRIPMLCTIHATEYGRNNGIRTEMQRYISGVEWMLTYESWKVIACSNFMKKQINEIFNISEDKIWVIPNGVDIKDFDIDFDRASFRRKYARENEKIVFYVGRHVYEKGIHLLIDSIPKIADSYNDTKFIIAGTGPMTEELKVKVKNTGLDGRVVFTGYMDDESKNKLFTVSDAAVFPSLYEPFGIVALEAMAAGCPVVVSDTGGLSEIVNHRQNGMKTIYGSAQSIADNVLALLKDRELSEQIKVNGIKTTRELYTWDRVSEITEKLYYEIGRESAGTEWEIVPK